MSAFDSEDYLWNGTGAPDPVLDFCERYGAELSYDAQVVARARQGLVVPSRPARRWAIPVAVAAMVAGVTLALGAWMGRSPTPSEVPSVSSSPRTAMPSVAEPVEDSEARGQTEASSCSGAAECSAAEPSHTHEPRAVSEPTVDQTEPVEDGPAVDPTEPAREAPIERTPSRRRTRTSARRPAVDAAPPPPTPQSFDDRVQHFSRDLQACFDIEAREVAGLHGSGMVSFSVQADGRVTDVQIDRSSFSDEAAGQRVGDCITTRVRDWRFPAPSEPPLLVRLPFTFK